MHCYGISSKDVVLIEKNQYAEQYVYIGTYVCVYIHLNMYV